MDDRATEDQLTALAAAFTGKLGGPLGELAELTDEVTEMERAPITFTSDGRGTKITVGSKVEADMQVLVGETDRTATAAEGALAVLLGPPEAGKAKQFRLALAHDQLDPVHVFEIPLLNGVPIASELHLSLGEAGGRAAMHSGSASRTACPASDAAGR